MPLHTPMTDAELRDRIQAEPAAKALADSGDDSGCAALIGPTLPPTIAPRWLAEGGVLAMLGPEGGDAALASIEAAAAAEPPDPRAPFASILTRIVRLLRDTAGGGLDFGNPEVRQMVGTLAAVGIIDQSAASSLLAAAELPAIVGADAVSRAWSIYRPDGKVVS